jgi:hypothetical protein
MMTIFTAMLKTKNGYARLAVGAGWCSPGIDGFGIALMNVPL